MIHLWSTLKPNNHFRSVKLYAMEYPVFKRKKFFSKGDILQKLKDNNFKIKEVCDSICEDFSSFDISDEDLLCLEDRLKRLEKVSTN